RRARLGRARDRRRDLVDQVTADPDLDLDLGQEIDRVLRSPIELGVALLAAEPPDLGDGHADHADLGQRLLHVVELEWFDDRLDLFHATPPINRAWAPGLRHAHAPPRPHPRSFSPPIRVVTIRTAVLPA